MSYEKRDYDFVVACVEWVGVFSLGGGWWVCYRHDDPTRALQLVYVEEQA